MKVLFLDIDGVINSERTRTAFNGFPRGFEPEQMAKFDHVALELVRKLCRVTGAKVVLSTSWRICFPLRKFIDAFDLPIIGETPDLGEEHGRGEEIALWLKRNPGVERYAIVDDIAMMLEEQQEFFVLTNDQDGLTFNNYLMLVNILQPLEGYLAEAAA